MAFASVEHIMRNVNGGHMIRYLHQNGASLFFIAVYAHILEVCIMAHTRHQERSRGSLEC